MTVASTRSGARISVRLRPATNVAMVYDAFDSSASDHFLGGGEQGAGPDLHGQIVPVKVGCTSLAVPYFASSAGWGLRLATENVAAFAFPGSVGGAASACAYAKPPPCTFPALATRTEACVAGARLDEDVYVGDFAQTLADYEADTGVPRVPPESEFALIKWRDVSTGPGDLLSDISHLQKAGVPIGWELLDNPWESCVGTLEFAKNFPDPAAMIAAVHKRGVRFMLWVSPLVECDAGYERSQYLGTIKQYVLDLRRPEVVRTFESRLRKLVALGVDGFKADRGDEVDFTVADPTLQNSYPLLYARDVMSVLPKSSASIFRAGSAGSQSIVPGVWAGDQDDDFTGLQQAILDGETAGVSGFPVWGSDVGGYRDVQPSSGVVFARWAQLGAVSPVLEVGGQGLNATPWELGPSAMAALRNAAVLHYELVPLFESLLAHGLPVLRPLGFDFPDDQHAWSAEYELMVGPDLLAAPVVGGGTTPSVYLPAGSWIDLNTGATVAGGGPSFTRATPVDVLPLYLRSGAVVPFDLRTTQDSWWGTDELSHPGRAGYLAADGATLDLTGQPAGVQVFVPAASRPSHVTIAGRRVAFTWTPGPLPGVVVRLHGPAVRGVIRVGAA